MTKPIYHGTVQKDLSVIKPFKRFTPGGEDLADTIPPRIYATYEPAFAVAHSFPWSSEDGIDIVLVDGVVTIVLPKDKQQVLEQEICIYTLTDDGFEYTAEEETGLTYHTEEEVVPLKCDCYQSVTEAMEKLGGKVTVLDQ
jgi:hypothetical protein